MLIDEYNFLEAQVVPEIYPKTQVSKTARCVFLLLTVGRCYTHLEYPMSEFFTCFFTYERKRAFQPYYSLIKEVECEESN